MQKILTYKTHLGDVLESVYQYFETFDLYYGHGTDNPWDEACALVLGYLNLPIDSGDEVLENTVPILDQDAIYKLAQDRAITRKPLAYLIHKAWFAGMEFYVDERVIIPRSPLAELIKQQFRPWVQQPELLTDILDLCTGSGCIALACANYLPNAIVDAVDLSPEAIAIAEYNTKLHNLHNRVQIIQGDLFVPLGKISKNKKYDLIITNPPYVDSQDMANLPMEYTYEPKMALAAGDDGLEIATRILKMAKSFLKPNGLLIVEVGNSKLAMQQKYPHLPCTWLEFADGGGGVFLLEKISLEKFVDI